MVATVIITSCTCINCGLNYEGHDEGNDVMEIDDNETDTSYCSTPSHSPRIGESQHSSLSSSTMSPCTTNSLKSISSDDEATTPLIAKSSPTRIYYKLVGDNIDKNVCPRDMRSDHQTQSFHFFHTYAVKDRVDLSRFSDQKKPPEVFNADELLPSSDDRKQLADNYIHLFIRVQMKYMPYFRKLGKGMPRHITHEYSKEMSQKSEVVGCVNVLTLCVYILICGNRYLSELNLNVSNTWMKWLKFLQHCISMYQQ